MRQGQTRQGRQVCDPRSREVQAEGSVIVGMQALVLDSQRVDPTPEDSASLRFGGSITIVTREKRENASDRPVARVQSSSLVARVSISDQVIRATSPAGRAT